MVGSIGRRMDKIGSSEGVKNFCKEVGLKGRDVLVAGIVGAGILFGSAKAQTQTTLRDTVGRIDDISRIHVDSTFIDFTKPRFMGLTYAYYETEEGLRAFVGETYGSLYEWMQYMDPTSIEQSMMSMYNMAAKTFPYSAPRTREDTIDAIYNYFRWYYFLVRDEDFPLGEEEIKRYQVFNPNKAASFLCDIEIIAKSKYREVFFTKEYLDFLRKSGKIKK